MYLFKFGSVILSLSAHTAQDITDKNFFFFKSGKNIFTTPLNIYLHWDVLSYQSSTHLNH